jgi:hypothetical protein
MQSPLRRYTTMAVLAVCSRPETHINLNNQRPAATAPSAMLRYDPISFGSYLRLRCSRHQECRFDLALGSHEIDLVVNVLAKSLGVPSRRHLSVPDQADVPRQRRTIGRGSDPEERSPGAREHKILASYRVAVKEIIPAVVEVLVDPTRHVPLRRPFWRSDFMDLRYALLIFPGHRLKMVEHVTKTDTTVSRMNQDLEGGNPETDDAPRIMVGSDRSTWKKHGVKGHVKGSEKRDVSPCRLLDRVPLRPPLDQSTEHWSVEVPLLEGHPD